MVHESEQLRPVNAISDLPEASCKFNSFLTTENLKKYGLIPLGFKFSILNEDGGLEPEFEEEEGEELEGI